MKKVYLLSPEIVKQLLEYASESDLLCTYPPTAEFDEIIAEFNNCKELIIKGEPMRLHFTIDK